MDSFSLDETKEEAGHEVENDVSFVCNPFYSLLLQTSRGDQELHILDDQS